MLKVTRRLKPGQSKEISRSDGKWVTVERSCDGKKIRYIRHTPNSWYVFRTVEL